MQLGAERVLSTMLLSIIVKSRSHHSFITASQPTRIIDE
jgi:hypothetical protein